MSDFPEHTAVSAAYDAYLAHINQGEHAQGTPESAALAVSFLSAVCDYYLNRHDGDCIHIVATDTIQR